MQVRSASPTEGVTAAMPQIELRRVTEWLLGFALVLYLALEGGGYDTVVRSEVGIVLWWIVLLGVLVGALPLTRLNRTALTALGALVLFGIWTALAIGWSESSERTALELGRVATYLGAFALALAAQREGTARHVVNGVTTAAGIVIAVALLSRLHPSWFPENDTAAFLPGTKSRLNYPFNYWNALGAFVAMALPLLLAAASSARTVVGQAAAAAAVAIAPVTLLLTLSRGGAAAAVIGLIVFFALAPRRLPTLVTAVLGACGASILIVAAVQRSALRDGLLTEGARQQGDELLAMTIVVSVGVALIQAGIALAIRYGLAPRAPRIPRRPALAAVLALLVVAGGVSLAAGGAGELSDRWEDFKKPNLAVGDDSNRLARFGSTSGNGRYQYWSSAVDANATEPLNGIGPGSFEFWWARNTTVYDGFVRDAHSLYFETLAELGIIGLVLLAVFMGAILFGGAVNSLRGPPERRVPRAAATAACASFAAAVAVDWAWDVPALAVAFLLLGAAALSRQPSAPSENPRRAIVLRAALGTLAVLALVAIVIPLAGTSAVRASQEKVAERELDGALGSASTAASVQPSAASPPLQRALILELQGNVDGATRAAREAIRHERTNWRNWLVLSRLEARRGRTEESVRAYRRAKALNPKSPLFDRRRG